MSINVGRFSTGSRISRQFTDSEMAIDSRVSSHLQAPPLKFELGANMGLSYQWLSEDMALRSNLTKELAGEQAMAYAQSERQQLAKQSENQDADDAEALAAASRINAKISSGQSDLETAHSDEINANPNLLLNKSYQGIIKDKGFMSESPEEKKLREMRQENSVMQAGTDNFNLEAMRTLHEQHPELVEGKAKMLYNQFKVDESNTDSQKAASQIKSLLAPIAYEKAKQSAEFFSAHGYDIEDQDAMIGVTGVLNASGVTSSPKNVSNVVRGSKVMQTALMDDFWMNDTYDTPEKKAAISEALDVAGDPLSSPQDKSNAEKVVFTMAAKYKADSAEHERMAKERTDIGNIKDINGKPFKEARAAIAKIVVSKGVTADKVPMIYSEAMSTLEQYRNIDPQIDGLIKLYADDFQKRQYKNPVGTASIHAGDVVKQLSNFVASAEKVRMAKERLPSGGKPPVPSAPSTPTPPPGGNSKVIRGGVTYEWNGAKYIPLAS